MRNYALISALLLKSSVVFAFPHLAEEALRSGRLNEDVAIDLEKRAGIPPEEVPFPLYPGRPKHASFTKFDPELQRVSQEGEHRFIAPDFDKGDIRGPCAGLNVAANHGYIGRNGIADAETIRKGLWDAFSLDITATTFLETATRFFDGDPISGKWSIGYYSPKTQSLGALGNALGNETGICAYGHSKTESDASITRGDWLAPHQNSNCASYPEFVNQLFNLAKEMGTPDNINAQVMARHQYNRKMHSIRTNPNYFSPAYGGVAFTFGAHMFAYELLGNHSAEQPKGFMRPDGFLDMWSYTKDAKTGELKYKYGHERLPPNWYKRHPEDDWNLEDILISTAQQCASYPANCQVGGNVGKVNSFQGVDPGDITGGLINSWSDLKDPAKVGCFISQAIQADVPAFLDKAFNPAALNAITKLIPKQLVPALAPLGSCGGLPKGRSQFQYGSAYPGAKFQASGDRKPYKGFH